MTESATRKQASERSADEAVEQESEPEAGTTRFTGWRLAVRELYLGASRRAVAFRYGLLAFDLTMITFVVVSSFFSGHPAIEALNVLFGIVILADLTARLAISRSVLGELIHPFVLADLIVVLSLLAPVFGENFGFLRVLRALRLFRSYQLVHRLRRDFAYVRRNQDTVFSIVNLAIFLFVMTALVYETQQARNPAISNYADALYFTVTTVTTTGFGDITLEGTVGRLLAVLIMIFGVSLFIRLAQTVFRPQKVHFECPECGLSRHDADAVHCKHCGTVIHIETEGLT
jgi:voltage-gated potassium channel